MVAARISASQAGKALLPICLSYPISTAETEFGYGAVLSIYQAMLNLRFLAFWLVYGLGQSTAAKDYIPLIGASDAGLSTSHRMHGCRATCKSIYIIAPESRISNTPNEPPQSTGPGILCYAHIGWHLLAVASFSGTNSS